MHDARITRIRAIGVFEAILDSFLGPGLSAASAPTTAPSSSRSSSNSRSSSSRRSTAPMPFARRRDFLRLHHPRIPLLSSVPHRRSTSTKRSSTKRSSSRNFECAHARYCRVRAQHAMFYTLAHEHRVISRPRAISMNLYTRIITIPFVLQTAISFHMEKYLD